MLLKGQDCIILFAVLLQCQSEPGACSSNVLGYCVVFKPFFCSSMEQEEADEDGEESMEETTEEGDQDGKEGFLPGLPACSAHGSILSAGSDSPSSSQAHKLHKQASSAGHNRLVARVSQHANTAKRTIKARLARSFVSLASAWGDCVLRKGDQTGIGSVLGKQETLLW